MSFALFFIIAVFPYLIRSKSKANAHIADEAHDYDQAVHNYQYGGWCGVQSMQKILQANEYTIKCLTLKFPLNIASQNDRNSRIERMKHFSVEIYSGKYDPRACA